MGHGRKLSTRTGPLLLQPWLRLRDGLLLSVAIGENNWSAIGGVVMVFIRVGRCRRISVESGLSSNMDLTLFQAAHIELSNQSHY